MQAQGSLSEAAGTMGSACHWLHQPACEGRGGPRAGAPEWSSHLSACAVVGWQAGVGWSGGLGAAALGKV